MRGRSRIVNRWSLALIVVLCGALIVSSLSAVERDSRATGSELRATARLATPTSCATGSGPYYPAYDPVDHDVYVPNFDSGSISVFNGSCHLVGTVTLPSGASPEAAAFDPANNGVYVTDSGLDHIYVIRGLTISNTMSGPRITDPVSIVWDPGDAVMIVTNSYAGDDVLVISGTTVIGTVPVGLFPQGLCYDPFYNQVLVVNYGDDNVTILNGYEPLGPALANLPVGFDPYYCAFDVADNSDYVTNFGDDNVSVITGQIVVGSVNVGSLPMGIAWDQSNLRIYVVDYGSGDLSLISGMSVVKTVVTHVSAPEGIVLNEVTNMMYLDSFSNDKVYLES